MRKSEHLIADLRIVAMRSKDHCTLYEASDLIKKLLAENARLEARWMDHDCMDAEFNHGPDHFEPYGPIEGCLCGSPCGCTCEGQTLDVACPVKRHGGIA